MDSSDGSREQEAALVLRSLRVLVHELRATAHAMERDLGLSGAQLFVLRELATEPRISVRRLSERTFTDPSSVSVVVARLVALGLVSRNRDPADGRRHILAVTTQGAATLAQAPEPFQTRLFDALAALPRAHLHDLGQGLAALISATQASPPSSTSPLFFEDSRPQGSPRADRSRSPKPSRRTTKS